MVTMLLSAILACSAVIAGGAQTTGAPAPGYRRDAGLPASNMPAPLREIGFDQNLDRRVPLDVEFSDERGRTVRLGEYFGARPVVLAFVYYDCPMLCPMILNSITASLGVLSLEAARDFELVMVSIDPRETPELAAAKKAEYLRRHAGPEAEAGWHFLTGDSPAIERLTSAAGFRYAWDEATGQFAHPSGIIVLTPDGRLARYLFGLDYGPRDLRLALVEASAGRIGSAVDALLLYCYHYDPTTGRYGFVIMSALRVAGVATVLAIGGFIAVMVRRERRAGRRAEVSSPVGQSRTESPEP